MSDDEIFAGFCFGIVATISLFGWVWYGLATPALAPRRAGWPIRLLAILPVVGLLGMSVLLQTFADAGVRESLLYQVFYVVMGLAWAGPAVALSGWLGISLRDDVWERRNPAAALTLGGLYLGVLLCYTGGNFGDGPGWWVVVISACVATLGLYLVWAAVELCTRLSELVTVERDHNAGFRLGALLVGCGMINGRGVAGDWVGFWSTLWDFLPARSFAGPRLADRGRGRLLPAVEVGEL